MHVCVFNGQQRVGAGVECGGTGNLGYDPKLISSHSTIGLLNFHTRPALLHNTHKHLVHGLFTDSRFQYENANIKQDILKRSEFLCMKGKEKCR